MYQFHIYACSFTSHHCYDTNPCALALFQSLLNPSLVHLLTSRLKLVSISNTFSGVIRESHFLVVNEDQAWYANCELSSNDQPSPESSACREWTSRRPLLFPMCTSGISFPATMPSMRGGRNESGELTARVEPREWIKHQ